MSRPPDQLRRSVRQRETPEEATARRLALERAEMEERRRRAREAQAAARRAEQQRLLQGPVTADNRSALDDIAVNLHNAYDWDGHADECVTAVAQGRGTQALTVFPQRYMRVMADYANAHYAARNIAFMPGGGSHLHAEMYAVLHYLLNEQDPSEHIGSIGASKPICPQCAHVLDHLGIQYDPRWITAKLSPHWIDPWASLPASCKPAVRGPLDKPDDEGGGGGGDPIVA
jgi:hypothetical protein